MKWLEFLQENDGSFSSMRLFALLVCLATIIDWLYSVFSAGVWKPTNQTVFIISSTLCLKVYQKGKE